MPSLFSRSRTVSTPTKKSPFDVALDEFGRVSSRGSGRLAATSKKDKKREGKDKAKARAEPDPDHEEPAIPDGSFLPLNLERPRYESGEEGQEQHQHQLLQHEHDYGYLSYGRHVVLGLEQVARLVDVVGDELGTRGLTTPFIFSTLALDVSAPAVKRLIQTFLNTCSKASAEADRQWREEAKFAGPHELGMCLRWGLARVVRIVRGNEVRGLVAYANYVEWRDAEAALHFPIHHFSAFLSPLPSILRSLLLGLFTLLSRFTAHSASSGHTPPTLSPLFGPLLFGLGPSTLAYHHVYVHYLRATTATEHLILAFIRWQDSPQAGAALGMPTRLKAWVQGYPNMLPAVRENERPQPRRGARTVRVVSVRRNVRMYSPDLVKTAASWAQRPRGAVSSAGERAFAGSKEWERIAPQTLKLTPRYSDGFKKRMDLPANFHPDLGAGSATSTLTPPTLSSSISSASSGGSSMFDEKEHGLLGARTGEDRFRSLTDLKWGEFEAMGFGSAGDEQKLQFDLTEGARAARAAKRATLSWQDFSSSGFSRTDAHLSATLQFSPPVANTINAWPSHSAEMTRKLKKTQKALPPFGWDTEPVLGGEEVIEEAFVDVFCDLVYGGGWMDNERLEETDRECNWALVEFKSLPIARVGTVSGVADPRTSTTLMLFEEFVPYEYRQQIASSGTNRRRLPSIFSNSSKSKQWKPAPTLNGRPYVVGHVPHSPSYREVEFEGMLRSNGSATKIISLNRSPNRESPALTNPTSSIVATPGHEFKSNAVATIASPMRSSSLPQNNKLPVNNRDTSGSPLPSPSSCSVKSRFRLPGGLPVSPSGRKVGLPPTEYDPVDFDTRLASFDDDDLLRSSNSILSKHARRRSKDDAWVDILVANNNRRIGGQDAELRNGLKGGRSDPELASQEVSEVLAAVREHFSPDDDDIEPVHISGRHSTDTHGSTLEDSVLEHEPQRDSAPYGDDEDEEDDPRPVRSKRLGYFDIHPERRPPTLVEDPRARFERPSVDSQLDPDADPNANLDATGSRPVLPSKEDHQPYGSSVAEKEAKHALNSSFVHSDDSSVPSGNGKASIHEGKPLPRVVVSPSPEPRAQDTLLAPAKSQTRTASLIEMYRERERSSPTPSAAPVPLSRLPVRTAASLHSPGVDKPRSTSPQLVPRTPSPVSASNLPEIDEPSAEPKVSIEDLEIDLPTHYIHGAPLHNVLEEEEEEEL